MRDNETPKQPEDNTEAFTSDEFYCAKCYQAFRGEHCPTCKKSGEPVQADDPILLGELPGPLRNHFQIAFGATGIPFTAMPTLGLGMTMSAGDILETYKIYVPYERSLEAGRVLFQVNHPGAVPNQEEE